MRFWRSYHPDTSNLLHALFGAFFVVARSARSFRMDHELTRLPDGQFTCSLCRWTWRTQPHTSCVGVPRFENGFWPNTLYTATQLRRMHMKPGSEPDGYYPLVKSPYHRYLYDSAKATPRRTPTEKQREAIGKMRAALVQTYTCQGCGVIDTSHGRSRSRLLHGYCAACRREIRHHERQAEVCAWAKTYLEQGDFVVLDSETTGLSQAQDEIIELALISASGSVLFSSLIQPHNPARLDLATHIHGITSEMLGSAPRFPELWPTIAAILRRFRRVLVYNADFDRPMLAATVHRYGVRVPGVTWTCLMEQYAVYHGAWSDYHRSYTWQQLSVACDGLGITVAGEAHRATADALAALRVLQALAAVEGHIAPLPAFDAGNDS
jgi:DNA polymerase III epsilon subunit-like protein